VRPIPEEINRGTGGANYGWPRYEGPESDSKYRSPVFAYRHGSTKATGCAITRGAFYNPATRQFPSGYVGDYFFADLCSGWIRRLDAVTGDVSGVATELSMPVAIKVSKGGSLYYLSRGSSAGSVGKIRYKGHLETLQRSSWGSNRQAVPAMLGRDGWCQVNNRI
jgi:glucose/arabinose dehydrogenase